MNETVAGKKFQHLKFIGVPWITIDGPSHRGSPHANSPQTPQSRSRAKLPRIDAKALQRPFFEHSRTLFTEDEYCQMRGILESDPVPPSQLQRAPSRLEQLQQRHPELKKRARMPVEWTPKPHDTPTLPSSRSIVSIGNPNEDYTSDDDLTDTAATPKDRSAVVFEQPEASDMRRRIWDFCHDHEQAMRPRTAKVRSFDGTIDSSGRHPVLACAPCDGGRSATGPPNPPEASRYRGCGQEWY
jgi:hypothetical protein